jgi:carboxypeptidase C (cathepsin A)
LKTQRDFLDTEAMSIHMSQSKDAREKLQTEIQENQRNAVVILEQPESKAKISRLQHAVAWLSVDDKTQEYNFETISNRRHDKTCQWIAKNDQLLSWKKDDEKHSLLWLNGKPGAGKRR